MREFLYTAPGRSRVPSGERGGKDAAEVVQGYRERAAVRRRRLAQADPVEPHGEQDRAAS